MTKKEQTSIDGLKPHGSKKPVKVKKRKKTVVKNTTTKVSSPKPRLVADESTGFDVKVTKRRSKPEELPVQDEIIIKDEELDEKTVSEAHREFLEPVEAFDFDITENKMEDKKKITREERKEVKEAKKAAKRERKKVSKLRKVITTILLVIVLLLIGGVVYLLVWGNEIIAKLTGGESNIFNAISTVVSEKYEPLKTDENGRTNILVFGTSGYTMEGDEGDGVHDGAQLTDSIMLVSIEQETGDVAMTSLPRDLKGPATCTATGKINEVYWCNNMNGDDEEGGAKALEEAVEGILGVEFQYYIHLNWGALVNIVDSIGGVKITLDEDIADYYYTGAVFDAGVEYEINGEQALGLARARHGTQLGDFSRGNSQQKILIGIKDKILEKGLGLTEILGLVNTLGDNLRTNFSVENIKTGVHLLKDLDLGKARQIALIDLETGTSFMSTAEIGGISYVVPSAGVGSYYAIQQYIKQQLSSDVAEREGAGILVLNGTGETGVAAKEKERLAEELKIKSAETGDAPEGEYTEEYILYVVDDGKKPETRAILEKFYAQSGKGEEELPEGVSADGYDFIIIVGGKAE